jgi:hypothetical protein
MVKTWETVQEDGVPKKLDYKLDPRKIACGSVPE